MKKIYLLLLLIAAAMQSSKASHIMGGELTYTWVAGNTYELQCVLYRDCQGVMAPSTVAIQASSSCFPAPSTVTLTSIPALTQQIGPVCPNIATTCNGGVANGIEKHVYKGTVILPGTCADWLFEYSDCCRNNAITNITFASNYGSYYSATLNNLNVPFNSSVRFASDPIPYLYSGTLTNINNGAFDFDNDSIVVSLAPAMAAASTPIPYAAGFSATNPVTVVTPIVIDPANGNVTIHPSNQEVDVIVYQIQEYRNGILVGSITRDFQYTILNGTNSLPSLTGINGSASFTTNACAGDTVRFTVMSSDLNLGDSTFIDVLPSGLGSIVTATLHGAQNDSVEIELIVDGTLISPVAHTLYLRVRDNSCPYYGSQIFAYQLYVNGCSANIWPGDANSDLSCNLYDLLPIGLGYSATGPVRSGASTAWVAQTGADWSQQFISGVNYKFADCNGDGVIDYNDTTAIALNYGQTHPARLAAPNMTAATANMYLISSRDTAGPNDALTVDIRLGDQSSPARQVYGIAFRMVFNPMIVEPSLSNLHFTPSQLGTPGVDLLTFVRPDWSNGIIDAVAVRMDHQEVIVDSSIGLFDVVIVDNVSARTVLNFRLEGVRGISHSGTPFFLNLINDSTNVSSSTTGINSVSASSFSLYPNPAREELRVSGPYQITGVTIRDLNGRIVSQTEKGWASGRVDIRSLNNGIYVAELLTEGTILRKTFSVIR